MTFLPKLISAIIGHRIISPSVNGILFLIFALLLSRFSSSRFLFPQILFCGTAFSCFFISFFFLLSELFPSLVVVFLYLSLVFIGICFAFIYFFIMKREKKAQHQLEHFTLKESDTQQSIKHVVHFALRTFETLNLFSVNAISPARSIIHSEKDENSKETESSLSSVKSEKSEIESDFENDDESHSKSVSKRRR
eukprot:TRINITY_DN3679_c0_g1_i3.p1 TRINITY_DN3679_c0_g1~~TRINITY_DN3679_c0_g1_i3.p1  ORF type:complete len:194 (+),score=67.66 TRINITY_DN3679_c0_g1_i3:433-1014(+)